MQQFEQYVDTLRQRLGGVRIAPFDYDGKRFWLKQVEQLTGAARWLKPNPQRAFSLELQRLRELAAAGVAVPNVVYAGVDFFVMDDAGRTATQWCDDDTTTESQKYRILTDCAAALIALHRRGITHGRPAMRDMAWMDSKVVFMDFESHSTSNNLDWLIGRDMLLFFYSLCREDPQASVTDSLLRQVLAFYQTQGDATHWHRMQGYVRRLRLFYWLLLPFRPVAKKDLNAFYRLIEAVQGMLKSPPLQ